MRIKKKNIAGNARNFITRSQAVRKLQISLADFRRLCIFKGIYPREPRNKKKANKGSTSPTTFYYYKDIQYLLHDPVLAKFREQKTFAKKLTKALGRGEVYSAKKLVDNKCDYKLDHIIKERYPSFLDAIRDIDDALNMLFLFSNLPATDKISSSVTKDAQIICNQWLAYVARERLLNKVFVSIKGVYYQANINGETVKWLVPFKFPENIPSDVDFRIMLTFLEFYSTLLHFVLYKLYTDSGLVYPPRLDKKMNSLIGGLNSYILESRESFAFEKTQKVSSSIEAKTLDAGVLDCAVKADNNNEVEFIQDEQDENVENVELDKFEKENGNERDLLEQPSQHGSPTATLFSGFVFYVGREVPIDILEFMILSCGGNVISESVIDQLDSNDDIDLSKVTHHIVDRPVLNKKIPGVIYIQPQWVFDSINKGELVSPSQYQLGEPLPPHLSPWGDTVNYDPTKEIEFDEEELEGEVNTVEGSDSEVVSAEEDMRAQKELELEAQGISYSDVPKSEGEVKTKSKRKFDEEKDLKLIMMSNKKHKLYKKMKYSNEKKEEKVEKLKQRKKQILKEKLRGKQAEAKLQGLK